MSQYHGPDTSDKDPEESWTEYWDRKRRERHGPDCLCMLCANEDLLKELGKTLLPPELQDIENWGRERPVG